MCARAALRGFWRADYGADAERVSSRANQTTRQLANVNNS
jgi:hypothetical protein